MTDPFPLQASPGTGTVRSAKLTIVASNKNPKVPLTVNKVSITLPIGIRANDLTNAVPDAPSPPFKWTYNGNSQGAGKVTYRFTPEPGFKEVKDQGLNFVFKNIAVNTQVGTFRIEIEEVRPDAENNVTLTGAKFPSGWGEVDFGVEPANITLGDKVTLDWFGPPEAEYEIEYPKGTAVIRIPKLGNKGKYPGTTDPPLKPQVTTPFTLHVWMDERNYHAMKQLTVNVYAPASIDYFRPRGTTTSDCVVLKDELTLEWEIQNADRWELIQEWPDFPQRPPQLIGLPSSVRSYAVRPSEKNTRYTLMVKDRLTEVSAVVNATLAPPVPVGTIVPYGAQVPDGLPPGWLYCNGGQYVKDRYPQLYPVIKDVYGSTGNPANGMLPDLRGYFVRGVDDGSGRDPGRRIGTRQDDAFQRHKHAQIITANDNHGSNGIRQDYSRDGTKLGEYDQGVDTKEAGTESETRPKNVAAYFVIYAGIFSPAPRATLKAGSKSKSKKAATKHGRAGAKKRRGGR